MGGVKKLFSSSAPELPDPAPLPNEADQEPEAEAVRDDERRKIRARRSMSGTLLSNPIAGNAPTGNAGGLLGRSG